MNTDQKRELSELKQVYRQYATVSLLDDDDSETDESNADKFMTLFDLQCALISLTGMNDHQLKPKWLRNQINVLRKNNSHHTTTGFAPINLIEFYQLYRSIQETILSVQCKSEISSTVANVGPYRQMNSSESNTLFDAETLYSQIDRRGKGWVTKDQLIEVRFTSCSFVLFAYSHFLYSF